MSTHGGDSFPGPNTLFGRVHRVSRSFVPMVPVLRPFVPVFRPFVPVFRPFVPVSRPLLTDSSQCVFTAGRYLHQFPEGLVFPKTFCQPVCSSICDLIVVQAVSQTKYDLAIFQRAKKAKVKRHHCTKSSTI